MDTIDQIYCINLDHRTDRWERMKARFKKHNMNVQRFPARTPGDARVLEYMYDSDWHKKVVDATKWSHLDIWQDALDKGYERILVFEDDIILHKNFYNVADTQIQELDKMDPLWTIFLFNYCEPNTCYTKQIRQVHDCLLAGAYIVKASSIRMAMARWKNLRYDADGITLWLEQVGRGYIYFPYLAVQECADSDIQNDEFMAYQREWLRDHYYVHYRGLYDDEYLEKMLPS